MADGTRLSVDQVVLAIPRVLENLSKQVGADRFERGHFLEAARLFEQMTRSAEFPEFLTTVAYDCID
jgi:malate synthase